MNRVATLRITVKPPYVDTSIFWTLAGPDCSEEPLESGQPPDFTAFLAMSQNSEHKNVKKFRERENRVFFSLQKSRFLIRIFLSLDF